MRIKQERQNYRRSVWERPAPNSKLEGKGTRAWLMGLGPYIVDPPKRTRESSVQATLTVFTS